MDPRLSIVQIMGAQRERAPAALARLRNQVLRDPVELIWVDADPQAGSLDVSGPGLVPRIVPASGLTYAQAAALGLSEAKGEYVAFLEDHAFARENWAQSVIDTFSESDAALVNYSFDDAEPQTYLSRAFLMAEYGRWMHPTRPGPVPIPACNNIAYRRAVLERWAKDKSLSDWLQAEYLLHRRIQSEGGLCLQATDAIVEHEDWFRFTDGLRANSVMKRYNAASASTSWSLPRRLFYAAGMAAAPPLHLLRLASSIAPRPALWGSFLAGLPVSVTLYFYMSFHEALGYLLGPGDSEREFADMELALKRR